MISIESIGAIVSSWIIVILSIGIFGTIAGLLTYYVIKILKHNYHCTIIEFDGHGHMHQKSDKGGIYVDRKTKMKRFFLKQHKVGLDPNNIPWMPSSGGKKHVYLLQSGLKNFRYLNFSFPKPNFVINVGEEDVNWAITDYEKQKKLFSQSLLLQLMPYFALAFVAVIILVTFIYFFKEFATLKEMAMALRDMSVNVRGTSVIQ